MSVTSFRNVFTSYSGALAVMVAAIPTAIGWTDLIPTLSAEQKSFGQVFVSILSFFSIGLVYYYRKYIGQIMLGRSKNSASSRIVIFLPVVLICAAVFCGKLYFDALQAIATGAFFPILAYTGIFVFPVLALAIMALKEYSEKPEGREELLGTKT